MKSFLIQDILADQPAGSSRSSSSSSSASSSTGELEEPGEKSPETSSAASAAAAEAAVASAVAAAIKQQEQQQQPIRWQLNQQHRLQQQHQHQQLQHQHQQQQQQQDEQDQQQQSAQFQFPSPLDALFQMASNVVTQARVEKRAKDRESDHHGSTNFTSKQTSKKKRKSRTAFTNNQIYELERRFNHQKYLSPTDRDEIAQTLNLSNAQVITWFQNRRAKLKRDLEERKRDIATATMLNTVTMQQTFLESLRALQKIENAIRTPGDMSLNGYVKED